MKLNNKESLFQEEEAYKNKLFPTKKPISSSDIKQQLNNSLRSIHSNITAKNKYNINGSYFDSEPNYNINKTMNNMQNLNILPELNYTNKAYPKNIFNNLNKVNNNINNNNNIINEKSSKIELNYCLGIIKNYNNCFCFHPVEKFFMYISKNIIVVEDFSIEKNRTQKLITDSEYELQGIKLSSNNKLLISWTNLTLLKCNPFILFYQFENYYPKFTLLNKLSFDRGNIIDCQFSPNNSLVIIISKYNNLFFISLFNFLDNKITITTFLKDEIKLLEFNKYITSLEFCTLGNNIITLWRINPFEQKLEYQNISPKLNNTNSKNNNDIYDYTTINYLQTNYNNLVLLLIGCSNSNIICLDSKTNSELYIFNNINLNKPINFICSNCDMLCFISDNKTKYCNLSIIPKQCNSIENYFNYMDINEIIFDSEIKCLNYNNMKGNDLLLITSKSNLYYINLLENASIKLFTFIKGDNHIINVKIIKKKYNNSYNSNYNEEDEIYYIITLHKNNEIKVWSIPEYNLIYNFETINEEIKNIDSSLDELFFVVSYNTNFIRFFNNEKFLGKFHTEKLGSYSPIILIKILSDSKYIYLIDESNTIYLIFLEQKEPLIIQFHKIVKLSYPIKDFNTSSIDCYNLFYVNVQNLYIHVYYRKYTNVIKNSNFASNTPEFYVKDKIHLIECFMGHRNIDNNIVVFFSFDIKQKNLIFILSKRNKMIVVRNFESHTNIKSILFQDDIMDFSLVHNNYYFFFLFNSKLQKTSINNILFENFEYVSTEELCEREVDLIGLKSDVYYMELSYDCLFMVVYSNDSLFIYKI